MNTVRARFDRAIRYLLYPLFAAATLIYLAYELNGPTASIGHHYGWYVGILVAIMVLIEYEIAREDVQAFLDAMSHRRRIRIRDGAQNWVLLRDLENPGLWKEAYHVPTWVDYVRHNHRRTQADADITARLLALNKGGRKPGVRRMIERDTVPLRDDTPIKTYPELP